MACFSTGFSTLCLVLYEDNGPVVYQHGANGQEFQLVPADGYDAFFPAHAKQPLSLGPAAPCFSKKRIPSGGSYV